MILQSILVFQAMGIEGEYLMDRERFYDVVIGTSPYYRGIVQDDKPLLSTLRRAGEPSARKPEKSSSKQFRPIPKKSSSVGPLTPSGV